MTTTAKTPNIKEGAGVAIGNIIEGCVGFNVQIDRMKTRESAASIVAPFVEIGGAGTPSDATGGALIARNASTYYQLKLVGTDWIVYNGTTALFKITSAGAIVPFNDNTGAVGSASLRWALARLVDIRVDRFVDLPFLPTSDPAVAGRLWRNGTTVQVSLG